MVPVALAGTLLYLAMRGADWRAIWTVLSRMRPLYFALACSVASVAYLFRALRWRVLLAAGQPIRCREVFWATMAGYLGNCYLPGRAGELVRTFIVSSRSSLSTTYVLTTALMERLTDAIALVILASLALLGIEPRPEWLGRVFGIGVVLAGLGTLALFVLPRFQARLARLVELLPARASFRRRIAAMLEQLFLGLGTLRDPGRGLKFVALTLLIWAVDAAGSMVLARSIGLRLPFRLALVLLAGLGLGSALPSVPGYVGIYQYVAVTVLVPFGFTRTDALAYILLAQAGIYLVVTVWGTIGLSRTLPGLRNRFRHWRAESGRAHALA